MLNTGKYKLAAALTGTAGGAYGSYKLYDTFGASSAAASSAGKAEEASAKEVQEIIQPMAEVKEEVAAKPAPEEKDEEKVEEVEEQEQVVENSEQPEPKVEDPQPQPPVEVAPAAQEPEAVKAPEPEKPAAPVVVAEEEPAQEEEEEELDEYDEDDEEPFEDSSPSQVGSSQVGSGTSKATSSGRGSGTLNTSFYGTDGLIKIKANTQGSKFQTYLIVSTKETDVWNRKVSDWDKALDQYKSLSQQDKKKLDAMSNHFEIDKTLEMYKDKMDIALQHRCYTAYSKPGWELKGSREEWKKQQYWTTVWKYCGKPDQNMPQEWKDQVTPQK